MDSLFTYIEDRVEHWTRVKRRIGWYLAAKTSTDADDYMREEIAPEWGDGMTLTGALRISSPILDIVPAIGTRLAVLSRDGLPELPAVVGALWDDLHMPASMSAWIRAQLAEHPGHIEVGAENGLTIRVGENTVTMTPQDDGTLLIDATGEIRLGENATEAAILGDTFIASLIAAFNTHTHAGGNGGPVLIPAAPLTEAQFATAKSTLVTVE